jgi:peptide deformylase
MILPILSAPDARLRLKSLPVTIIDQEIKVLIKDMFDTMYALQGCGLAAPQIGVHKRVVVMDLDSGEDNLPQSPKAFINPEILKVSSEMDRFQDGCLSVPGDIYEYVERPKEVLFRYLDEQGKSHEVKAQGLLAKCIHHETDHLNGILFIDYLSRVKREKVSNRLKKYHSSLR